MKKLGMNLVFLLSALPVIAVAGEDCLLVDFPDHVELVCTGDGMKIPDSEQQSVQNRITAARPVAQPDIQAPAEEKNLPAADNAVEPVKPGEMVIVPKTLQVRLDRAAQTMERMRLQKLQRASDQMSPYITPPATPVR